MSQKQTVWLGMFVGSVIGEMVPSLWGAGAFSFSTVLLSAVGAIVGIYLGFKMGQ